MRKVIAIGETSYDILFNNNIPSNGYPGGRILNAAVSLAQSKIQTTFVSECGQDYIGDKVVNFLAANGVDTNSVDRFTDGVTRINVVHEDGVVKYGKYPNDRFDVIWPRIDKDDIIIFGSLYSVDTPQRERLFEIIKYAQERKAILIYIPGFHTDANFRMTKVTTAILENLEVSNIVLTNTFDIKNIFGDITAEDSFHKKIEFYCPNYIHITPNRKTLLFTGNKSKGYNSEGEDYQLGLGWRAGYIAGIVYGLLINDIKHNNINDIAMETWDSIINNGYAFAENANRQDNIISADFGNKMDIALKDFLAQNKE